MNSPLHSIGAHEKRIKRHFGTLVLPDDIKPVEDTISIMVFINRSGSSLVSEYLRATGAFSGFGEPLNYGLVIECAEKHGIGSFAGYLDWLMENIRREGTQFGMKASYDQVTMLLRSGAIPRYFNKVRWIFVQRRDILSQANSFSIAEQTLQWHSFQTSNGSEPVYDFADIKRRVESIANSYAAIHSLLGLCGIEPCYIAYEEFLSDPLVETKKVATFLGVDNVVVQPAQVAHGEAGK